MIKTTAFCGDTITIILVLLGSIGNYALLFVLNEVKNGVSAVLGTRKRVHGVLHITVYLALCITDKKFFCDQNIIVYNATLLSKHTTAITVIIIHAFVFGSYIFIYYSLAMIAFLGKPM